MRLCRPACPALACKLCFCVHIHKPVCTGSCSQMYLFALRNQVKTPTSGSFCFCAAWIQKKRVWLTQSSSVFDVKCSPVSSPGVRHWSERPGQSVCVCVLRESGTKWLMIDSRQTCKHTDRLDDWQVDRRTASGPLEAGHSIRFFVKGYLTPLSELISPVEEPSSPHHRPWPRSTFSPTPPLLRPNPQKETYISPFTPSLNLSLRYILCYTISEQNVHWYIARYENRCTSVLGILPFFNLSRERHSGTNPPTRRSEH